MAITSFLADPNNVTEGEILTLRSTFVGSDTTVVYRLPDGSPFTFFHENVATREIESPVVNKKNTTSTTLRGSGGGSLVFASSKSDLTKRMKRVVTLTKP